MSSSVPSSVSKLSGHVSRGQYGQGSKSERQAVFIDTSGGRYLLRRKKGPVFDDSELKQYVGHKVECDGFVVGTTLLADRIEVVEE